VFQNQKDLDAKKERREREEGSEIGYEREEERKGER
jgi:hypothetical protein